MKLQLRNTLMVVLCFVGFKANATHIVGGDFYYNQISSNVYEIVMELYLDCYNGNPGAIQMDEVAIIGVFNARTNTEIDTFEMWRSPAKRVNVVNYVCALPPSTECIDQYTYKKRITLPSSNDGYILAFQRCCRNFSISNIQFPEATGATYWVKIPGKNSTSWNNPARFRKLPPNYLCTNEKLVWDHSAIDPDGDSLAYELYQPYQGASQVDPRPFRPSRPPYQRVVWSSGYNTMNQMQGNPIMTIDRNTGQLTVTPNREGQFVVGIKVLEFRNGVLIHETLRDYQMNVYKCQPVINAAFFKRKYECSDTVNFINLSKNGTHFEWYFGDPTDTLAYSELRNPRHIYPGNGTYRVKLVAKDDRNCTDTVENNVQVLSYIEVDIGPDTLVCDDFEVYLEAKYSNATSIWWSNGKFGQKVLAEDTGRHSVKVYYESCFGTDTMFIHSDQIYLNLPQDSLYCESVNGTLDAGIENVRYKWSTSPADTFRYLEVNNPGTYRVNVVNQRGCVAEDSIYLFESTQPRIGPYMFVCNEFTHTIDAGSIPEARYLWDNGSTNQKRTINSEGVYWVQVKQRHCLSRDTLEVINPVIPLDLGNDTIHCDSLHVVLSAPDDMAQYIWSTEATSQSILVRSPGTYSIKVIDTNGCTKSDTIDLRITPSPVIDLGQDTGVCVYAVIEIGIDQYFTAYSWNVGETEAKINVSKEGLYILTVTDEYNCQGTDSIYVSEDPDAIPNELFIPNAFTPNNDGLNDLFPYSTFINQREYQLQIFNRWGQKVFDSEQDSSQSWNGLFQDEDVNMEAFIYLVHYRGCDGDLRNLKGTVTVLR